MNYNDYQSAQPLRELTWLANYFKEHGREDLARQIFLQIKALRLRAQDSLRAGPAEVVDLGQRRRNK